MKNHILLATSLAFAAQANALLAKSDHALALGDAHLPGEGFIAGLFSIDDSKPRNAPNTLISLHVLEGSVKAVEGKLQALIDKNPYNRPLKLLTSVSPVAAVEDVIEKPEESTGAAPAKKAAKKAAAKNATQRIGGKFDSTIIVIVGTFQP